MFSGSLRTGTCFLRRLLLLIATAIFVSITNTSGIGVDTITPAHPLIDNGTTVVSPGQTFVLGFFGSGSGGRYVGIWYYKVSVQTVVWVANRGRPITGGRGILSLDAAGNLTIFTDENSTVLWSSSSPRTSGSLSSPVAQLLDDGNFVIRESGSSSSDRLWQSFDFPTDTLLPGMKLGWNLTSGLNRKLTAWTSETDPAPSGYTMGVELDGYAEIFLWSGTTKKWRAGPWNGLRFSGIPEMKSYDQLSFEFVVNRDEVFYSFYVHDPAYITRLIVNQSGITQRLVWIEQDEQWNPFWFAPKDPCDDVSPCGPNGFCNPNESPMCECLPSFHPRNPTNWDFRDGRDGCLRNTDLDCRNRTDGFTTVVGAKLPDTSSAAVDMYLSLDNCKDMCLQNCSCTAYAAANISGGGSGIGCITWTSNLTDLRVYTTGGQDLYVRLAASDLDLARGESKGSRKNTYIVIVVLAVAIILLSCAAFVWRKKRISTSITGNNSFSEQYLNEENEGQDLDLPLFDLGTITDATGNFSIGNKLGEGGFGPVYKGQLGEDQEIAVKRLSKSSVQGLDEFKNEVVLIAKLQHRNLVRLLGCCIQGEEKMLIYEYMPNKSLDANLFDKARGALLDWRTRYNIIVGIARGLLYLHQDSRFRIIHRDLKASNVLLDKDMNPKISDFGMARIFGGDETEANTRKVVGTYGYMAPEYAMDGVFSVKSDVFSFGVLVIEIISGKKNRGIYSSSRHLNLLGHAWSLYKEGKILELVDESIDYSFPMTEAVRCLKIGLLCVQNRPEDRPTMSSVVLMLGSEDAVLPEPREPGFVTIRGPLESDSSTSKPESITTNHLSITIFEGR
ncbi:receptor-like serine/threonine-protein kinase SD1-8 [Curcuma longa]|uniref:receptor-like serine/threonine-protein kinase SD1-8 n=1 Tax=Curcuma longa TaxID=136217 RepID=UPI003D9EEC46